MSSDGKPMDEQHNLMSEEHTQRKRPFGNYDLIQRIDMGGMGEVYLAHQRTAFHREVAVKVIRDDLSGDAVARARFFREAEVSSHLKHDHILPLFEFGEVQGRLFLVTPYISGGTLAQRLQAGPLSLAEVQPLFIALVQAVAYIHRRGVVHRDLKPSNILLDNEEETEQVYVRLIDFGIATKQGAVATPPLTTAGHEIGTLAYMAPERLNGIAAPSNDIYSLGVILYQMLTGRFPVQKAPGSRSFPQPLEAVVQGCIAANPEDRYASAPDVLHAFGRACQAFHNPATSPVSQSTVIPSHTVMSPQPIYAENPPGAHTQGETGDMPTSQLEKGEPFGEADYAAPTIDIAYAHVGMDSEVSALEKQNPAVTASDLSVFVPGGKKLARRDHSRQNRLLMVMSLLIIVVLFVMAGLIVFEFPPGASASVTLGPQVHVLQQAYTITAQPSQTGIDVATASIPAREQVDNQTSSQTEQTTSQQCNRPFFFQCRQVVTPSGVENLSSQLRQSLTSQLSTEMDSQLQALHATAIGSKQFTDLSESSNPAIGTVSKTITVTLTDQGSVEYINGADAQQLARLLLAQELGPNTLLLNSTVQIGQPVVEAVTDLGMVTMKVATAGVEEYQYPSTQLQAILNHIKGMTLADAHAYLRQQPGVDANSVSISIHTTLGDSNKLPDSTSQIKIIPINPTSLPSASLPALPTPAVSPGSPTPTV
jgi:serine/threonine protein kinase